MEIINQEEVSVASNAINAGTENVIRTAAKTTQHELKCSIESDSGRLLLNAEQDLQRDFLVAVIEFENNENAFALLDHFGINCLVEKKRLAVDQGKEPAIKVDRLDHALELLGQSGRNRQTRHETDGRCDHHDAQLREAPHDCLSTSLCPALLIVARR